MQGALRHHLQVVLGRNELSRGRRPVCSLVVSSGRENRFCRERMALPQTDPRLNALSFPQSQPALSEEKSKKLKRRPQMKRRSQAEVMKEREDECFSCGDGGQLVSCKKAGCPKVYHADCLNLTKRPAGQCNAACRHGSQVCSPCAIYACRFNSNSARQGGWKNQSGIEYQRTE